MRIKALEITQNDNVFYLGSINCRLLEKICSTNMENIKKSSDIYQRRLNESRVNQISLYAKRAKAIFPTCVVLNARDPLTYDSDNMELIIPDDGDAFFIIDGQHRIAGISKSQKEYQLGVVILNSISVDEQSELFITINSEQKSVHPNVRFNMKSKDKYYTPEKMVRNIAEMFNCDPNSPLYKKIWMDDSARRRGEYPLSLSSFCDPLCAYIYNSKDYYSLKDVLYEVDGDTSRLITFSEKYKNNLLWSFYVEKRDDVLYKILLNYFSAVSNVYVEEWNDSRSIIMKTTGYNAFMILFKGMFIYCKKNGNVFSYERMHRLFKDNKINKESFYVDSIGVGRIGSYELFKRLKPSEFEDEKMNSEYMDSLSEDIDDIRLD